MYLDDVASLDKILAAGAERAREVASGTLRRTYEKIGFVLPE
jgi:tryptophanyl-tRNA synthetase